MSAVMSQAPAGAGHRHWQQGVKFVQRQQWLQAAQAFGRATRAAPGDGLYWMNLANAQRRSGALAQAVVSARRALECDPRDALSRRLLADTLMQMHHHAEAAEAYAELDAAGTEDPDAMLQHAAALLALRQPARAAALLLRVLQLKPALANAHALLGDACRDQGLKREAVECIKTVLALEPGNVGALSHLSFEKRHLCDWAELDGDVGRLSQALRAAPEGAPGVVAAFGLLSLPLAPELQLKAACAEALAQALGATPLPAVQPAARQTTGHPRIRVGWLSYDFREHPVSQLLVEVLEAFDRSRFELHLYSAGPDDGSALRQRMQATATRFVDLAGLSDQAAAERMRADGIDILVDLMGHTRGHRMPILARRPAPLQVAYLGYPGSTGAGFIDYIVGDPLVTPLQLAGQYTEKLAQLPLCFQPNGRSRPLPQPMTRAQAGLPEEAFVMCAFNHTYKILPEAFDAWCAVLREVPDAVLWFKQTNGQLHDNVLREAEARGVARERIVFARNVEYADHFSRLALADVFVDTWPYNAHTTAADALWAGVPVVTVYGNSFASRVAASALNAAGIGELARDGVDSYVECILTLARHPELCAGYKAHLQQQRQALPLFDTARYAHELQQLFERMLARWRDGLPCDHLTADPSEADTAADEGL